LGVFFVFFFVFRVLPSSSGFSPLYTYYRTLHNDAQISSPDGRNEQHTRTFFFPPSFYSRPFSLSPLSNCMFPCIRFLFDLQSNIGIDISTWFYSSRDLPFQSQRKRTDRWRDAIQPQVKGERRTFFCCAPTNQSSVPLCLQQNFNTK
jgi:hypothetical protein